MYESDSEVGGSVCIRMLKGLVGHISWFNMTAGLKYKLLVHRFEYDTSECPSRAINSLPSNGYSDRLNDDPHKIV